MLALPLMARGAELVVVEARGIGLRPGEVLDDSKTLSLDEGQHVTLIAANGETLKLDGPYDRAPTVGNGGGGSDMAQALRALVTQSEARREAGLVRGAAAIMLPDPWLMPVSRPGIVCIRDGAAPVIWREAAAGRALLTITPADRTWHAEAEWPAGRDRMKLPPSIPLGGGDTYRVRLDNSEAAVTVKAVPPVLTRPEMVAAWLADVGCEPQAAALLRSLP